MVCSGFVACCLLNRKFTLHFLFLFFSSFFQHLNWYMLFFSGPKIVWTGWWCMHFIFIFLFYFSPQMTRATANLALLDRTREHRWQLRPEGIAYSLRETQSSFCVLILGDFLSYSSVPWSASSLQSLLVSSSSKWNSFFFFSYFLSF